jgi:hypothetical protein
MKRILAATVLLLLLDLVFSTVAPPVPRFWVSKSSMHPPDGVEQRWFDPNFRVAQTSQELARWNKIVSESEVSTIIKIHDTLPAYKLKISGVFKPPGQRDKFTPTKFEITDAENPRLIQRTNIRFLYYGKWDRDEADFQLVDINCDGYLDLRIMDFVGATGTDAYATYLYEPKTAKFKYHRKLSGLSAVTLDPELQQIKTYERDGGWCHERREYFKIEKDKLTLVRTDWTEESRENDEPVCYKLTKWVGKPPWKEKLEGSLDGRSRGPLGNPHP